MTDPEEDAPAGTFTRPRDPRLTGAQRRTGIVAVLLLLVAGIVTLRDFLPALVWAVIFAVAIWPSFDRATRRWPSRARGTLPLLYVLAVLLGFVVPLALVAVPLYHDAVSVAGWLASVQHNGVGTPEWLYRVPFADTLVPMWRQQVAPPGQLSVMLGRASEGGMLRLARVIGSQALHRVMLLGFMLLTLFFLLRDGRLVAAELRVGAQRAFGPAADNVARQIVRSIHGTVDGMVLVGIGIGVLCGLGYWVAGVPQPALWGLVTVILAMIPFGAPLCVWASGGLLVAQGHIGWGLAMIAWGLGIIFVADHVVRPALIGGATKLPFVWVLLGILGGVEAWGLVGLFMGPAIMAALVLIWREWVGARPGPINPVAAPVDLRPGHSSGSSIPST